MKKPFVIGISGLSGSGKTAVTNALRARLSNAAVISFDDYGERVYLNRDINEWSADSNDDEWHTEPIAADVELLLNEPLDYIILDYPFGYGNRLVGQYINFTVFIDVPLDVALARRIIRDFTSRDKNTNVADVEEVSLDGLDKELRFYLTCSRSTYARMPEMQKPTSDLVVDGTKKAEEIADEILTYIDSLSYDSGRFDGSYIKVETDEERRARIYPIILSEYNPAWPQWFKEEKEVILHHVGAENIVRISHIGSTAVPGLTAKPTVDILLEIKEDADVSKLIGALPPPEYICLNPPAMPTPPPHLRFIKGYTPTGFAERVFHIHVRYPGDWDEPRFRDYLIAHPKTAAEYVALKRRLHNEYEHDRDGYTAAKTEFVRTITQKAKEKKNECKSEIAFYTVF